MKISSLHDDLLWPCVAHACGLGEFDDRLGRRVSNAERSPLIRSAQFGVPVPPGAPGSAFAAGEAAYADYCASLVPALSRHYETVVAAIFDRYFSDLHNPAAPPSRAERERGVLEDLRRYGALCDLPIARNGSAINAGPDGVNLLLAVEGMDFIHAEESVEALLTGGVRIFALQYNRPNALTTADAASPAPLPDTGLTPLGRQIVLRIFAAGAIVDLAHAAWETRRDIFALAESGDHGAQVGYTHGSLQDDPEPSRLARMPGRYLYPDEARRILRGGGMVGLTPARLFFPTLEQFVARVASLFREEGGATGVALGTDFGGLHEGLLFPEVRSVTDLPRIADLLAERHDFTDAEIDAVLRTNVTAYLRRTLF